MPKVSMDEFMNRSYSSGSFGNTITPLKKFGDGETVGWLHSDGVYERVVHGSLAAPKEDPQADKADYLFENCGGPACPLCALKEFAVRAIDDGHPTEETILSGGRAAKSDFDYTLLDVACGTKDNRRHVTGTRTMVVFPWISHSPKSENLVTVLEGPAPALGGGIRDVIRTRKKHKGDERGDPTIHPWPMELVYDEAEGKKNKTKYYRVQPLDADDAAMTEEQEAAFRADLVEEFGINMEDLTGPGDCDKIMDFIHRAWVCRDKGLTFGDFVDFYEKRAAKFKPAAKPAEKPAAKGKPASKPAARGKPSDADEPAKCTGCGEPLDDGAKFCPACGEKTGGAKRADADEPADEQGDVPDTKCPHCKKMVIPTDKGRCPECAKRINDQSVV